jgi:endonuclease YncB( thermonuclease family)
MKTFLAGLACGVLLSIAAITYLEFSQESTGGFTAYIDPLLSQLNEVIPTDSSTDSIPDQYGEEAKVLRVIDGDTIDVEINGERQRVRYIGMNTPERNEACFDEATQANVELVKGKTVMLVKDVSETDRYDRLLRYVYVGDTFVNEELVRLGYAEAVLYRPDDRHYELFSALEAVVAGSGLGCHGTGVFGEGDARR